MKKDILKKLLYDIRNGTSHSVDYLLSNNTQDTLSKKGIKIRKIFSPLLRAIYLTQTKYKLIKEPKTGKVNKKPGKIFVMNHRQADDIALGANAIGEHAYVVFGNKDLALETTYGLGLFLNGVILVDRSSKESRKAAYEKMKFIVENGGNVWIFPEGYWNLADDGLKDETHEADCHDSECWLMQDINIGALRLAKETGSPIVPVILHYDEVGKKRCYSKRGSEFYINSDDDVFKKKDELMEIMNTTYYNLMEKYSSYSRAELESDGISLREKWIQLKEELVRACDIPKRGYKLDLKDEKRIGKAKVGRPFTSNEEAFEHTNNIVITKNNAFLLSKRLSGQKKR